MDGRRAHGAPCRQKGDHEAIADRVDFASVVLGELRSNDPLVFLDRASGDLVTHTTGQIGRALDVGEHDRDDAGVELVGHRAYSLSRRACP